MIKACAGRKVYWFANTLRERVGVCVCVRERGRKRERERERELNARRSPVLGRTVPWPLHYVQFWYTLGFSKVSRPWC